MARTTNQWTDRRSSEPDQGSDPRFKKMSMAYASSTVKKSSNVRDPYSQVNPKSAQKRSNSAASASLKRAGSKLFKGLQLSKMI